MQEWSERTLLLFGEEKLARLADARVLVVGIGGVGAYAAEMLVRAGVGSITIVDGDSVSMSNINRQLLALHSTVGRSKTEVLKERLLDINPDLDVCANDLFLTADNIGGLFNGEMYNYVIDAIDTVAPKVSLIEHCLRNSIKIISSMGAGGRIDPSVVQYADIADTYHDGLAKAVRTRLRDSGMRSGLKVVWSPEQPCRSSLMITSETPNKRSSYGTVSYMPCVFGCMLAAYVIRKISG